MSYQDLYQAVVQEDSAAALAIIDSGLDLHANFTKLKNFILDLIVMKGMTEVLSRFIQAKVNLEESNYSLLWIACHAKQTQSALHLINAGVNVNVKNDRGYTPLLEACRNGLTEVALRLIDVGVDINAVATSGFSPLMYACQNKLTEVALRLIDLGVEINIDAYGYTPLVLACENNLTPVVLRLIKAGCSYEPCLAKDEEIQKALSYNFGCEPKFDFNFNEAYLLGPAKRRIVESLLFARQNDKNFIDIPNELFGNCSNNTSTI